MNYPFSSSAIIDVTKPPYNADNTGKKDCTQILRKILDDILIRQVTALRETYDKLIEQSENKTIDTYINIEGGRVQDGDVTITFPEFEPSAKIIYFPKGTYLVSDTVTYTLNNLKGYWYWVNDPYYENNRQIHFLGESKEETVIRLVDGAKGFESGKAKPVISYVNLNYTLPRDREYTNVAFCNTIEDITIDCGKNNAGAIGIKYVSSNCGRIENVAIKAEQGVCGIYVDNNTSQAVFTRASVSGFDYGIDMENTCHMILEDLDLSGNEKAGIYTLGSSMVGRNIMTKGIPTILFKQRDTEPSLGRYYLSGSEITVFGEARNQEVCIKNENEPIRGEIPFITKSEKAEDWAFVDDFGAVGDGKTDSTRAIQKAMDSGKPFIAFGEGEYFINAKIKIPNTVKCVDFLYCSLACGDRLIGGEYDSAFEISEDGKDIIFIENLSAWEHFKGHIRLIKHNAKRDAVLKNIHLMAASMYFNSIPGSKVYVDNCFLTTGTYVRNAWIPGKGFVPVSCHIIPYEFHGQTVYGRLVNPERADIAMLNDNSKVVIDGFRTEGCGTALKAVNGGTTKYNLFNAGVGYKYAKNPVFDVYDSKFEINLAICFGGDKNSEYNILISDEKDGKKKILGWDDAENFIPHGKFIKKYSK